MGFCNVDLSTKTVNIFNDFFTAISLISLLSSILLIILVLVELKRKSNQTGVFGKEFSKFIICVGIYDFILELIILFSIFIPTIPCQLTETFLTLGAMGEYITTPFISIYFWGMLTGRIDVRFSIYLLISIPFCVILGYLFGWYKINKIK